MGLATAFIYAAGALICHQRPERSFFVAGQQLPVCARCTGLYVGGAAMFLAWWGWKLVTRRAPIQFTAATALRAVAAAGVPTVVSWTSGVLGVWDGSNLVRAVLAIPLGLAAGAVVAAVSTKDLR